MKKCIVCGSKYEPYLKVQKRQKYCSYFCSRQAEYQKAFFKRKEIRENKPLVIKECKNCKTIFTPPVNAYAKFCSEKCQNTYYKKNNRNKVLNWKRNYRHKHPEKVKEQLQNARDKSYFGGLRRKVWERDKFSCRNCGKEYPNFRIIVHHRDENKKHNTMDNLITLCCSCHAKAHNGSIII